MPRRYDRQDNAGITMSARPKLLSNADRELQHLVSQIKHQEQRTREEVLTYARMVVEFVKQADELGHGYQAKFLHQAQISRTKLQRCREVLASALYSDDSPLSPEQRDMLPKELTPMATMAQNYAKQPHLVLAELNPPEPLPDGSTLPPVVTGTRTRRAPLVRAEAAAAELSKVLRTQPDVTGAVDGWRALAEQLESFAAQVRASLPKPGLDPG